MKAVFKSRSSKPGAVDRPHDSQTGKILAEIGEHFETDDARLIDELVAMGYVPTQVEWDDVEDADLVEALKRHGLKLVRAEKQAGDGDVPLVEPPPTPPVVSNEDESAPPVVEEAKPEKTKRTRKGSRK